MNNKYVLVKLETGEQLMAELINENTNTIMIQSPMLIRQTVGVNPVNGRQVEKLTSAPFCQFTKDRIFTIKKEHIMFINDLHPMVIEQYISMVNVYEKEVDVYKTEDGYLKYGSKSADEEDTLDYLLDEMDNKSYDDDFEEDEEDEKDPIMSIEDVKKTISALTSIIGDGDSAKDEIDSNPDVLYVEGNDTIN
jgi:hypothetical protein